MANVYFKVNNDNLYAGVINVEFRGSKYKYSDSGHVYYTDQTYDLVQNSEKLLFNLNYERIANTNNYTFAPESNLMLRPEIKGQYSLYNPFVTSGFEELEYTGAYPYYITLLGEPTLNNYIDDLKNKVNITLVSPGIFNSNITGRWSCADNNISILEDQHKATISVSKYYHTPFKVVCQDDFEYIKCKTATQTIKGKRKINGFVKVWPRTKPIYGGIIDYYSVIGKLSLDYATTGNPTTYTLSPNTPTTVGVKTVTIKNGTTTLISYQVYYWNVLIDETSFNWGSQVKTLATKKKYNLTIDGVTSYPHQWYCSNSNLASLTIDPLDNAKVVLETKETSGDFWIKVADSGQQPQTLMFKIA